MFIQGLRAARRLSDFKGRDNNFNLLRILAATLVVATHAMGITGNASAEPFGRMLGIGGGDLGVDVFFVLSGYLVTKSFAGKTLGEFAWARCMRIYPGLWASTLLTVLVAGIFLAKVAPLQFFTSRDTLSYIAHNLTMLPGFGAQKDLSQVFDYPDHSFNLPLWTLPHELQMYMLLTAVGAFLGLRARYIAALVLIGGASAVLTKVGGFHLLDIDRSRFIYFFFAGSLMYAFRERIALTAWIAVPLLCLIVGSNLVGAHTLIRQGILVLAMPYLLLWCAYVPGGILRLWNRLGDYSYGVYIYAFPIQVALLAEGMAVTPVGNFAVTMLLAFPISIASWHLIEKRALRIPPPWGCIPEETAILAPVS